MLPPVENITSSDELSQICPLANRTLTTKIWTFEYSGDGPRAIVLTVELLIYLTAFFWNLFIIVYMLVKREKLKDPPNVFLFSLSAIDLTATLLTAPFYMGTVLKGEWVFGGDDCTRQSVCEAVGFILSWLLLYQTDIIAAMAFDRFLAIAKPLHYRQYLTWRRALLIVLVAFVFALIPSVTPLFGFGVFFFERRLGACLFRWSEQMFYVAFFLVLLLIPIGIITVFTVITYWKIRSFLKHRFHHHTRRYTARSELPRVTRSYNAVQRNVLWLFTALLAILAICWLPGIVTALVSMGVTVGHIPGPVFLTDLLFVLANIAANPIIHAIFSKDIRSVLKRVVKFFCCFWCCCRRTRPINSNSVSSSNPNNHSNNDSMPGVNMTSNVAADDITPLPTIGQTEHALQSNHTDACCDMRSQIENDVTQTISIHLSNNFDGISLNSMSAKSHSVCTLSSIYITVNQLHYTEILDNKQN